MNKTIVVIPNHHDNLNFLREWQQLRENDIEIIIMQDNNIKDLVIPDGFNNITIIDHDTVNEVLGKNAWIIPTGTSACRSFGYYMAWLRKPDAIITLDNDCFPDFDNFVQMHNDNLSKMVSLDWWPASSTTEELKARGYPYLIRDKSYVALSHGLWSNVPDYDGGTMLHYPDVRFKPEEELRVIPRYNFFPMCGMNLAWKSELTPALYFGLFGADYGFDQFDDIWAGILVKKVLDYIGAAAVSGRPSVEHRKQSNAFVNMKKQAPGMAMNEEFWLAVKDIELESTGSIADVYMELISKLPDSFESEPAGWTKKFKKAALIWGGLFK